MCNYSKTYLLRVLRVQDLYMKYRQEGVPDTYTFRTYIYPTYPMTMQTFYNYMALNAKREIKLLNELKITNNEMENNEELL